LSYIAWHDDSDPNRPEPQPREFHIDLARWFDWAESQPDGPLDLAADTVAGVLRSIDPLFTDYLDVESASVATDRLDMLLRVWSEPSIPILATEVNTPLDVLEVFTRINLGGVQVGGADVFFAAVKTFWPEAERSLDRLAEASRFLDRMGALRFVSRLASRAIRQGDLLPMTVDRLAGNRGRPLIEAISQLTVADSPLIRRLTAFSEVVEARSKLGFGLRLVSWQLWDEVLIWAVAYEEADGSWFTESLPLIDAYLFGASLFRYPQILGDRYQRAALMEAAAAGASGQPFPLERILSVTRGAHSGLRGTGGAFIRRLDDPDDRDWIKTWNAGLLLCIAQRLPYQLERRIDWDHIFPQAQAQRMRTISESGYPKHHPKRGLVNSAGNMWGLDSGANQSLQDTPPARKFDILAEWQKVGTYPVWARDQWSITEDEVKRFIEVDQLLNDDAASVNAAMELFDSLVTKRADRLLDQALTVFPEARLFSADALIDPTDASPESLDRLADSLGVSLTTAAPPDSEPTSSSPLPHPWTDRDVEGVIKEATRRHTNLTQPGRWSLPYGPGDGFDGRRYVPVNGPVPYILVGIVSRFARSGETPIWLQVPNTSDGYAMVRARINASPFVDEVRNDGGHIWLPLVITPELEWTPLAEELYERILEIRQVIESGQGAGPIDRLR
jgi:hypothetical protein